MWKAIKKVVPHVLCVGVGVAGGVALVGLTTVGVKAANWLRTADNAIPNP